MATTANHLDTHLPSLTHPIHLRTVRLDDAPAHAALISSPEHTFSVDHSRNIIPNQRRDANKPSVLGPDGRPSSGPSRVNMVVCRSDGDGELVIGLGGYGAIKDWQRDGKNVRAGDCGVVLAEEHRGKGYAVEAMRLAIDWAFRPVSEGGPQLDIVTVTTMEGNVPMLKLTDEKLGLKGRGVLRPAEFDKEKQEMYYEITAKEWEAIKAA